MTKYVAFAVIAASLLAVGAAHAQTSSGSYSAQETNVLAIANGGGSSGSGGSTQNVRDVPAVAPPPLYTNNVCMGAVSFGGSGMGFGFGGGFTVLDNGCDARASAGAFHALGHDDIANAIMCKDKKVMSAAPWFCHAALQSTGAERVPEGVAAQRIAVMTPAPQRMCGWAGDGGRHLVPCQ